MLISKGLLVSNLRSSP
ncbi:unnamed protein product [Spirodela intermedia]|uniref:Uncharacterized protein n=2 Tax=Spirodela intermedia TaxID=51605 RepID=A0A7I8IV79_SPIIN|nr:unnamed protein product [Spirodela intermedia]CAA6661897.1 unnamed protein product [Spirodela intermedia]CAA7398267.1 unnamed protein product [Spirodela intermedia]